MCSSILLRVEVCGRVLCPGWGWVEMSALMHSDLVFFGDGRVEVCARVLWLG